MNSTAANAIRMGRIMPDPERPKPCEAATKTNCPKYGHAATYRIEKTNQETGEVWRRYLCTRAGAAWADRNHIKFPPGPW